MKIRYQGVYIDVSQTKHGILQMKTSDYMPKVATILANCNLNFVTGTFSHWKKRINIMETIKMKGIES